MISSTGTSIETYLNWVKKEIEVKEYGEVQIVFTITKGQITGVKKASIDMDRFELKKDDKGSK